MRHIGTLRPKTAISDSPFSIDIEKTNTNHTTFPWLLQTWRLQHWTVYFLCFMGTVCILRLQLLTGSQEIIVLLLHNRTSHSEQPSTFTVILLVSDTGLLGRIVQHCYISLPILQDHLRTPKSLQYSI